MKIYNTLTRKKEEFVPIEEGKVKMYVCGPTVYNYFHIGNARPFVVFDTMRKYLEYRGYKVKYVQNFTDVDDKIINRAKEEGVSAGEISEKYIAEYFKDAAALNVKKATVHPKVTETMDDIIQFVQDLIDKGYAYESDGDVYYRARKFKGYGKLSGKNIDDLISGARIAVGEKKEDPLDFALWKARKEDSEIAWGSPWGMGRPGWHIECSTMAKKYLGDTIDIHAGGQDLQFPHHENEIAQSEAHNGKPFAHYWMHNGYINIDGIKMSKSLGNFKTVRDLLAKYYRAAPDGIPGNDDTGTMSAWAVFSMIGFYPDYPGNPSYTMTVPAFDRVKIELEPDYAGGHDILVIENRVGDGYSSRVKAGEKYIKGFRISHSDLLEAGTVIFEK